MLWSLWLWDILLALHTDHPTTFSASEISSTGPFSSVPFQKMYRELCNETWKPTPPDPRPEDRVLRDQGFLLIMAILSDAITMRRSLGTDRDFMDATAAEVYQHNPFTPLSAREELDRMEEQLWRALDRYDAVYGDSLTSDLQALYQYTRLYISCKGVTSLCRVAHDATLGAPGLASLYAWGRQNVMRQESVDHAWSVLHFVAKRGSDPATACPTWFPIVTFHAALVVWARISQGRHSAPSARGGENMHALSWFKTELEVMQFPCCTVMVAVLDMLMSGGAV